MAGTPKPAHPPFSVADAKSEAEQLVETVGHGRAGRLAATQCLEAHVGIESKLTSSPMLPVKVVMEGSEACRAERR